ncbi:hypothetical protein O3M35_001007 [Rhynocoris fuscipes]|uniref:Gamma-tubulin complex component n=1 Tax=Rhynocoris fuscipes TaxID=488301 RepID=A0AAW1DTQ1_9HEMI
MYNVYLTDNTDLIGGIEFIIPESSLSSRTIVKNIIAIDCKINWPLHYLFSPQVIENFNKMFRFLLRVKKAQMDVSSVWMDINHISDIKLRILAIEIRNQLLALIGNLQNYCFTDVIANECNLLMFQVEKSDTYTELQTALTEFQSKVMRQLFLMTDKISTFFITIFDLCEIFSKLIHKSSSSYIDTSLTMFKANLEKTIESMFNFLEKFETCVESPDVRNLLTNLDTNRYFRNKYCTS